MLIEMRLKSPNEMKAWDEFVQNHPAGTPYHKSEWINVLKETYGFNEILYAERDDDGILKGIFPFFLIKNFFGATKLISLPFSDYGGPLFINDIVEQKCIKEIIGIQSKKYKYMEIRGAISNNENFEFTCHNYYKCYIIDLVSDFAALNKKIHKRTIQYSIRKAAKNGIEIGEDNSESGMNEFIQLNALTRKKHGVPGQPKLFFVNLYKNVINKRKGFLILASRGSKVVAGSIFLKCAKTIHYKFNASDPKTLKKLTPNHSIIWKAVEKAYEEGYNKIDLGRTSPDNIGLMRYKSLWGTRCFDMPYFYYPTIHGLSSIKERSLNYKILTGIWRRAPQTIADRLEPIIYKHMV